MAETVIRTLTAQVAERIREKILAGVYAPGAPLLQDEIAVEFGISRIPIREALVQLRAAGLVDIFAHRGFQVRPLSNAELDEVFRLRLAVEPAAIAHGAQTATESDRDRATQALATLNQALDSGDLSGSGDLNSQYHLSLIVPRLQPVTHETLYRLHTLAQRYVRLHLAPAGRGKRARKEHATLHRAWLEGRAKAARMLAQAHIEKTRQDLAESLISA